MTTLRFDDVKSRPLEVALAIRSGIRLVNPGAMAPLASDGARVLRKRLFAGAVPVLLDQVNDWWDAQNLPDGDGTVPWPDSRLEAFPRLPWQTTWAEWRERRTGEKYGVLLQEYNRDEYLGLTSEPGLVRAPLLSTEETVVRQFPQAYKFIVATLFEQRPAFPELVLAFKPITWMADINGRPIWNATHTDWQYFAHSTDKVEIVKRTASGNRTSESMLEGELVWVQLSVWRLFTALLQVKGTVTHDMPLPRHVRRQLSRKGAEGECPWVHVKTLSVRLLGSRRTGASGSGQEAEVPLHLVRGCFADYREGPGLFGKYHGLVWRPQHLRGRAEHGAIAKVYDADMGGV